LRSADADVERYLKLFTFLPLEEINVLMEQHEQDRSKRIPQHKLASEFVELIHGLDEAEMAEKQHRDLFSKNMSIGDIQRSINQERLDAVDAEGEQLADLHPRLNKHAKPQSMESNSSTRVVMPKSLVIGEPLSRILYSSGIVASKSEGQRLVNAGGVYIGAQSSGKEAMADGVSYIPAKDTAAAFVKQYIIDEELLILRAGKWKVKVIEIIPDEEFEASGRKCPGWPKEEAKHDVEDDFTPAILRGVRKPALEGKTRAIGPY
jgi:tyrosyl-tRNA synthetase